MLSVRKRHARGSSQQYSDKSVSQQILAIVGHETRHMMATVVPPDKLLLLVSSVLSSFAFPFSLRDAVVLSWVGFQSGSRPVVSTSGPYLRPRAHRRAHPDHGLQSQTYQGREHLEGCAQCNLSPRNGGNLTSILGQRGHSDHGDMTLRDDAGSHSVDVVEAYLSLWGGTDPE